MTTYEFYVYDMDKDNGLLCQNYAEAEACCSLGDNTGLFKSIDGVVDFTQPLWETSDGRGQLEGLRGLTPQDPYEAFRERVTSSTLTGSTTIATTTQYINGVWNHGVGTAGTLSIGSGGTSSTSIGTTTGAYANANTASSVNITKRTDTVVHTSIYTLTIPHEQVVLFDALLVSIVDKDMSLSHSHTIIGSVYNTGNGLHVLSLDGSTEGLAHRLVDIRCNASGGVDFMVSPICPAPTDWMMVLRYSILSGS